MSNDLTEPPVPQLPLEGHCPRCWSDDPHLRGGPSIGYGCYDEFHDSVASRDDRELAARLREGDLIAQCPFCPGNWSNLEIVHQIANVAVVVPLNPVVDGHVLVIHRKHTTDAAINPDVASDLMFSAALWVQRMGIEANIITSIGANATQTIRHTHVHVVPRRQGDGLTLPWTGQKKAS